MRLASETTFGTVVADLEVTTETLAPVAKAQFASGQVGIVFVLGRGFSCWRELRDVLVAVNRYSMECGGCRVYRGV